MKFVNVKSEKCGEQLYLFPDVYEVEKFIYAIGAIKHGDYNWFREPKTVISSGIWTGEIFNMKYIVAMSATGGKEIFVFPKSVYHNEFADAIHYIDDEFHQPVSAGFIDGGCYGRSASLDLNSLKTDTELLKVC